MEYGKMLDDAFSYAREGVLGNGSRWVKLIIGVIILTIPMMGYVMRIYRGAVPAPEADNWGTLFIDGLKLIVIGLLYSIPIIILEIAMYYSQIAAVLSGNLAAAAPAARDGLGQNPVLLALMFIVEIIIGLLLPVAMIRFARMNRFREAFNFGAVIGYIGKIGWLRYILALIIVALVIGIPVFLVFFAIIIAGIALGFAGGAFILVLLLMLIVAPPIEVFQARYMTRVYDSAAPVEPVPAEPVAAV